MIAAYAARVADALSTLEASTSRGPLPADVAVKDLATAFAKTHDAKRKVIFIGNGGSAAIASHAAADYSANGPVRAIALTDASSVTCIANDYGYEHVFDRQLQLHGDKGDVLVVISSSGESENVVRAARSGRSLGLCVVSMTGFSAANRLRALGQFNFWVPASDYGIVETAHTALLHLLLNELQALRGRAGRNGRHDKY